MRINAGQLGLDDLEIVVSAAIVPVEDGAHSHCLPQLKSPHLDGIVIPKVDTADQLRRVDRCIDEHGLEENKDSLKIIASVESPLSLLNLREVSRSFGSVHSSWLTLADLFADCYFFKTT